MPAPPNTTPATAIDLGPRPVALPIDVTALAGGGSLWYRLTVVAGEFLIGLSAVAAPGGALATLSVFSDAGITPYLGLSAAKRLQMPVTPGAVFYVQIGAVPAGSTSVALTVDVGPNLATPVGSLAINDDAAGFPLVVLSAADGTPQQFRGPFPAGEAGAAVPDGHSLWQDEFTGEGNGFVLFDARLTPLATIPWPADITYSGFPAVATNRVDRFYLGDTGGGTRHASVTTVSVAGVLGATVWTLGIGGLTSIAVSPDEMTLYYAGNTSDPSHVIFRWDLVGNVALPPIAASIAGAFSNNGQALAVLADGTLLLGFTTVSGPTFVNHYAPDGSVLRTYAFAAPYSFNKLTAALDDPVSFWVWLESQDAEGSSTGMSRFQRLRVSDGVVLTSFDVPQYEEGLYFPTGAPTQPFGHSFSCAFVVLPVALTPFDPGGDPVTPGGDPDGFPPVPVGRIRRLRRAPHLAAEQVEQFFARLQLDLEAGVGTATDPGTDPQIYLRWSDDGGHTWRTPLAVSAGPAGAFRQRAIWRRLGRARDRVFEVSMTDPVKWALLAASLDATKGTS